MDAIMQCLKKVLWVLQDKSVDDFDLPDLTNAIQAAGDIYQLVRVNLVDYEIPDIVYDGLVIPYGGTNWINKIWPLNTWNVFFNEDFNYKTSLEKYGKHMFNSDAVFMKMRDFSPSLLKDDKVFIRPNKDLKEFTGNVIFKDEFIKWFQDAQYSGCLVDENTDILVSSASKIDIEWRVFIVDGVAVSASQYRVKFNLNTSAEVPQSVLAFAEEMAKIWGPMPVFVMDICSVNGELSILEIGDFHSAGWYKADKTKIVKAVSDYAKRADWSNPPLFRRSSINLISCN